ncbi:MAG: insulinase family protein [Bacilli bacterium]|nr:insulinase family protein [Bacilli bacterium]
MKYIKKDLGSYNLHLINTDKFKTITVKVLFHAPIKKDDITKRSIISNLLLQSTNKYNSRRNLTIKSEELYSADINVNKQRLGNYIFTSFNLQVLENKYTENNNFEEAIEFLTEILFNPDVENKKFKKEKVDYVKQDLLVKLNSIKETPGRYSSIRLFETFDNKSPLSYRIMGYLDDLEKIDEKNLYETYIDMINNDFVDIFVVGDFDNKEMISLIKKYFKFKKIKKPKKSYILKNRKARLKRLFVKEEIDNTQSNLSIACPIYKLTKYERDYALVLGNLIFGGGVDSKLFRDVRETNSLCYSIFSYYNKMDNMIIIKSGIDKINYQKAVTLITKKLDEMKKGKFNEDDISSAKEELINYLEGLDEDEGRMINEVLTEEILESDDIKTRINTIKKVKKSDIVKAFKKVHMDTVFLLEGVLDEEN